MLHLTSNVESGKFELNLPTTLSEITKDYLLTISDTISVAEHYALVAICHRTKLIDLLMAANNKKPITTASDTLFIKANADSSNFLYNCPFGAKLITDKDQIAIYKPLNLPNNVLSIQSVLQHTYGDKDLYKQALSIKDAIYCVEVVITPIINIHGIINNGEISNNEFIKEIKD